MVTTLHAVKKICQKPASGLQALAVIEPADLAAQPVWYLEPTIPSLEFLPDKAAFAFEADSFTARLTEKTLVNERDGDRYEYLLQAFVSGNQPEVDLYRAKIRNRRYHVVATYQNGMQRFLPFMRLSADADSGDRSNKNGYSFSGVMRMHRPAPYLNASFNLIGGPYVPPAPGGSGNVSLVELSTSSTTKTYTIEAGKWLVGWEVRSNSAQEVSLGYTPGGSDLGGPVALDANQVWVGDGNMVPTFTSTTIYFSGLQGTNYIRLWLLG